MCTIGAVTQNSQTFLLKNFDYPPAPTGWAFFYTFDGGYSHFALVDHDQQGLNSGLNARGLALQISRSKCLTNATPEREELRTVLNAEVLMRSADVAEGLSRVEAYAAEHPEMLGGNVMLGDRERIAVVEYFAGQVLSEIVEDGFLARANHSALGVVDNETQDSVRRYERMVDFLQELYTWLPTLDGEDVLARCRAVLRQEPILNGNTRCSFIIDVEGGQVDYLLGRGWWQSYWLAGVSTASR